MHRYGAYKVGFFLCQPFVDSRRVFFTVFSRGCFSARYPVRNINGINVGCVIWRDVILNTDYADIVMRIDRSLSQALPEGKGA
jgi:hypothetical protein